MDELLPRLQSVFRLVFGDDELTVGLETSAADVEGWDSLMHINVLVATEKEFGVRFATAEISDLKQEGRNVGHFVALLARKLACRS